MEWEYKEPTPEQMKAIKSVYRAMRKANKLGINFIAVQESLCYMTEENPFGPLDDRHIDWDCNLPGEIIIRDSVAP